MTNDVMKRWEWSPQDSAAATAEGWDVFDSSERGLEIERIDDPEDAAGATKPPAFASDDEAIGHVYARAQEGSVLHQKALLLTLMRMKGFTQNPAGLVVAFDECFQVIYRIANTPADRYSNDSAWAHAMHSAAYKAYPKFQDVRAMIAAGNRDAYAVLHWPYTDVLQAARWTELDCNDPAYLRADEDKIRRSIIGDGDHISLVGVASPGYLGNQWQQPPSYGAYDVELQDNRSFAPIGRSAAIAMVARDMGESLGCAVVVLSHDTYQDLRVDFDDVAIEQGALDYMATVLQSAPTTIFRWPRLRESAKAHREHYADRDFTQGNAAIFDHLTRAVEAAALRRAVVSTIGDSAPTDEAQDEPEGMRP